MDAYLQNSKMFSSVLSCLTNNKFTVNNCFFVFENNYRIRERFK